MCEDKDARIQKMDPTIRTEAQAILHLKPKHISELFSTYFCIVAENSFKKQVRLVS